MNRTLSVLGLMAVGICDVHLSAQQMIGVEFSGDVYRIDGSTGFGTYLGPTGYGDLNSLAKSLGGNFYAMSGGDLLAISDLSGAATFIRSYPLLDVRALAFDTDDKLYAIENGVGADWLYQLDLATGDATLIGSTDFPNVEGMAYDEINHRMYAWDLQDGFSSGAGLIELDLLTGMGTDVYPATGATSIRGMGFDAVNGMAGAQDMLHQIDLGGGTAAVVGGGGYVDLRGIEYSDFCRTELSPPTPGIAGTTNTMGFKCARPFAQVAFVFGFAPGLTTAPCGGVVSIDSPVVGPIITADAAGTGTLTGTVPASWSGLTVYFQAVAIATCARSNLVVYTFL